MELGNPEWFALIKAWLKRGRDGLTLPFLVGAIAYHRGKKGTDRGDIELLVNEIIQIPVEGYIVHIRWCLQYGSAVFAVYETDSPYRLHDRCVKIQSKDSSVTSVVIENNLAAEWQIQASEQSLLKALIDRSEEHVLKGNYSRFWSEDGVQYGPLQEDDIQFIEEALGAKTS